MAIPSLSSAGKVQSSKAPALSGSDKQLLAAEVKKHGGLRYVSDAAPGIRRIPARNGFTYLRANGSAIREKSVIERIRALAIPPARTDVWICPSAAGHIQATGRDAKGRKQYIYHTGFRQIRDKAKYEHLIEFAQALPVLRERVKKHMALKGLPRRRVLATIVHLLETTLIRIGNADYAKKNRSYGVTTLRTPHVQVSGAEIRFHFKGKTGKTWRVTVKDRRVAKVVKACQELPGQQLFQYEDEAGKPQSIGSTDVNRYLREVTGRDITAKDFRTWAGTLLAALELAELPPAESAARAKRNIRLAANRVAERLGNTPTICLNCYIHPGIISLYSAGALRLKMKGEKNEKTDKNNADDFMSAEEMAVLAALRRAMRLAERSED
jgi:DNA topoisomerase-1